MGKESKRKCIECASQINKDAIVCMNCKAYQNWRRFIPVGNTTLALAIAFISVLTMSFDKVVLIHKSFFADKERASFHLSVNTVNADEATITIKNVGDGDIFLPTGFICTIPIVDDNNYVDSIYRLPTVVRYPYKKEVSKIIGVSYEDKNQATNIILKPNDTRRIKYDFSSSWINSSKREPGEADLYPSLQDESLIRGHCFITIQDALVILP
ncbi:hypothetical protein [Wohlfahrtiimonas chitiniclastica]|uniref:hypothetical protein n=1 Tax=Wohlfahrtiimonas chitiniclastica TaxID=400946 RepID=UPI001BCAE9DD|nr:hypothetical protein [Wohlfahrtiimonas chitiniclastica]MBS7837231.1 hypothetical protein [Wohlfahrtiimonas chitiniclastica]